MSLRARAHIHLANIADNWRTLVASQPGAMAASVVKADAYGHGLAQIGEALRDAGCDHFFVAHVWEGEQLRRALGPHPIIYVLNGPDIYEEPDYREFALTPVINSDQQFQTLVTWIETDGKLPRGYVLHFDTGMNRLGIPVRDAANIAEACESLPPSLIMSHLSCSDTPDAHENARQLDAFRTVQEHFPDAPASLANSDGVWLGRDYHFNLTRPGIALYGGGHPPEGLILKPGLTLEAPILQIRAAKAGDKVGYGAAQTLEENTLLATVALGYGDGFPRSASHSGVAMIGKKPCPIVGRVSMDLTILDVSAARDLARPGVFAQFIGQDVRLEDQAARAGTIGYELITGLTPRVRRLYD